MSVRVVVSPEAAADLDAAERRYENAVAGLGAEFARSVQATIGGLGRTVQYHATAGGAAEDAVGAPAYRDLYRIFLRRFPHALFFRLAAGQIQVVRCLRVRPE